MNKKLPIGNLNVNPKLPNAEAGFKCNAAMRNYILIAVEDQEPALQGL